MASGPTLMFYRCVLASVNLNEFDDPDVAELQQERDMPRLVAEKTVKEGRRRAIAEMPSHSDKVQ
jgi:hypothetical protein